LHVSLGKRDPQKRLAHIVGLFCLFCGSLLPPHDVEKGVRVCGLGFRIRMMCANLFCGSLCAKETHKRDQWVSFASARCAQVSFVELFCASFLCFLFCAAFLMRASLLIYFSHAEEHAEQRALLSPKKKSRGAKNHFLCSSCRRTCGQSVREIHKKRLAHIKKEAQKRTDPQKRQKRPTKEAKETC